MFISRGKTRSRSLCSSPKPIEYKYPNFQRRKLSLDIIRNILEHICNSDISPKASDSSTPFLLLDGRRSRSQMPFLLYLNSLTHRWVVCIDVPNGSSLWQVGDRAKQKRCFKIHCNEYKHKLTKKIEMGIFNKNLLQTDIITIVNYGWNRSFAKVCTNFKAI